MSTSDLASVPKTKTDEPSAFWKFFGRLPIIRQLKDLNIGAKLNIGFGILVGMTLIGAVVGYQASIQATGSITRTEKVRFPTALASSRAQADLLRMLGDVRGYLALGQEEYRTGYNQSRQAFEAGLAELERLSPTLNVENRQRLADLEAAFEKWSGLPEQLFELRDDQLEREPAYRLLATDGLRTGAAILIDLQSMIEAQAQRDSSSPDSASQNVELLKDMAKFQGSFTATLSGLRGYVTTRNRTYRQEYEVNLEANEFDWQRLAGKKEQLDPNQQRLLANIEKNREAFLLLPGSILEALESERWREDLYLFRTQAVPLAEEMQRLLAEMTADQQILLETDLNKGRQELTVANFRTLAGGVLAVLLGLSMAIIFRENIAGPVRRLTGVAEQIRTGHLEARARVESGDEIGRLAETFNNMTAQLRQTLLQVRKEKKRADDLLEVVIPIGVELASEKDFNRLLESMLLEAKTFCHADAGILYLRTEDERLEFVIVRNDTLDIQMGGSTGKEVTYSQLMMPLPLFDKATGQPNDNTLATHVALTGESLNIADAGQVKDLNLSDPKIFKGAYQSKSYLTLPLKNSQGHVIGVLQLINAQDAETREIIPFDQNLQRMMESFSSLAVAALEAYIREQKLKQEIRQLRIEIDEVKRQKQVEEIVETDFFQDLKAKAQEIRKRGRRSKPDEPDQTES
ncbi:MAG: HAMP domain-containing protein [Chloroflexota bacterium]